MLYIFILIMELNLLSQRNKTIPPHSLVDLLYNTNNYNMMLLMGNVLWEESFVYCIHTCIPVEKFHSIVHFCCTQMFILVN